MAAAQRGRGSTEYSSERGGTGACAREEDARRPRGFQARDERTEPRAACNPLGTFQPPFASRPPSSRPHLSCVSPTPRPFWVRGFKVSLGFEISRILPRHARIRTQQAFCSPQTLVRKVTAQNASRKRSQCRSAREATRWERWRRGPQGPSRAPAGPRPARRHVFGAPETFLCGCAPRLKETRI